MALQGGKKLGPYEILAPIGKGGMGEVYRARDTRLDRDVAIKVLPEATSKDELALSRFTREAKAVAALSHPNILAIYDVGESDGIAYVVTELLEGETLRERLTQTHMAWRQALEFAATIADGLAAAHAKGVIHRDLKPENVFLTNDGVVKILDFGLARLESPTPSTDPANTPTMTIATAPGAVMGTIHYMSPEQVRGLKTDAQSDIFSFGCVLYEMVSGERAFQGKTAADTMTAILREEPESVTASVRGVGPELDRLVVRCLDKRPERRFHSASDLAFTLRSMLSDSGSTPAPAPRQATGIGGVSGKVFVAGLILVVGYLGWREWIQSPAPAGGPIRRIAVLPLENRSGDPDQEIYADAMTEAITDALAQVSALHVISPRTMLRLKGSDLSISELAARLNVDAIVDASRIEIDGKIQVRARLVEGATGRQIWSDHYERDVRDVFAMQNDIALAVADGVKVKLTPTEQAMLADAPTVEPNAYDLYVEGLHLTRKKTKNSCVAALSLFDRALEIDPEFALAHAGKAVAYTELASTHVRPSEAMPQARQAAMAALSLDPNLPEALVALGDFELRYKWNWDGAEDFYKRALDINASHSGAEISYALYLTSMKRFGEAKQHLDRVQEIDPDAKQYHPDYGGIAFMSRDYPRVVRDSLAALKDNSNFWPAMQWLGLAREQLGQMTEAISDLRKAHEISQSAQVAAMLGGALANAGEVEEARGIRKKLKAEKFQSYVCPYEVATISIGLKEYDQAFDEMDEACDDKAACIPWLQVDPRLDPIRHLPQFDALLRRVGFEPEGLTAAAIPREIRLAVLPFKDNSPKPKKWLASGMAHAISTRLGRVNPSKLGVLGPETTTYYAQPGKSIQDLCRGLNVDFVLRGSIQNIGNDVRITAYLISAGDFTSNWSDEFNGTMDDPFDLQSMVAEKIIAGLPFELTGQEKQRLRKRYAANPKAELDYMHGRDFSPWDAGGAKDLLRAVSHFEQAIKIDPEYALAYCGLVNAKCYLATWGTLQSSRIRSEMADTVARALALDDTLAEAHVSAGTVATFLKWDWPTAEAEFERAIQLDPNLAHAHLEYGHFLVFVGRYDEAKRRFEETIYLDPVSSTHLSGLGMLYAGLGKLGEAETLLQEAFEINNDNPDASFWLADVRQKQGRFDDAVEIMERSVSSTEHPELARLCFLGNAYAMAGRMDDARKQLAEMHKMKGEVPGHHLWFAELHAALGEKDEAFRRLDQALAAREPWLPHIRFDPGLIHIRSDPRFVELHRKMGLGHVDLSITSTEP